MLYWFLPYINMNQPWVYVCPLHLESPTPFHQSFNMYGAVTVNKVSTIAYTVCTIKKVRFGEVRKTPLLLHM